METDTKHEQNNAHFGEIICQIAISYEAGHVRANKKACCEIADNR